MVRSLRLEFSGALYHITSRGDRRENIYEDDNDRSIFLSLLNDVCDTYNWELGLSWLLFNEQSLSFTNRNSGTKFS